MKTKIFSAALIMVLLFTFAGSAFALPRPCKAHYPRGGTLTLSPAKEANNTYAFKASGRAHNRVHLQIIGAYAESCDTTVSIQMFVVNRWRNWIAFGEPKVITLNCTPTTYDLYFPIRARKEFCIVVTSYGISGQCVIPYVVSTD